MDTFIEEKNFTFFSFIYPFNTFCLIWEMWVEGANHNTPKPPPSHSWGRFSAHIFQIKQKVLKGYMIESTIFKI